MKIIDTDRLTLRSLSTDDADFILDLLNQPAFIKYIGNRNVRNSIEARTYIENRFLESYQEFGFGMYLVELKKDCTPIGICGFVKRSALPDPDIGFAFLPQYWSQGFAFESATAMLDYGKNVLGFENVLAITSKDNDSSAKLLFKLGFRYERDVKMSEAENEVKLFSRNEKQS